MIAAALLAPVGLQPGAAAPVRIALAVAASFVELLQDELRPPGTLAAPQVVPPPAPVPAPAPAAAAVVLPGPVLPTWGSNESPPKQSPARKSRRRKQRD